MTVDFLLAKLKTLAKDGDGVAWDGVEADLQALVRTTVERCMEICKNLDDRMTAEGYPDHAQGCRMGYHEIRSMLPSTNARLLSIKQRSHNLHTWLRAVEAERNATSPSRGDG